MIKIFLKDFIKTGKFGPLEIGSSKEDVIDFFGEDYDFGNFGETQIIKYGWWEFFYWTETKKVFAIQNDHLSYNCSHHVEMISLNTNKVEMDTWFLKPDKHVTFDNVTKILTEEKIDFKLDKFSKNDELDILRLNDIKGNNFPSVGTRLKIKKK